MSSCEVEQGASVYTFAAGHIFTFVRFRSEPAFSHAPHGGAHTLGRRRPWVRSSRESGFDHFDTLIADAGNRAEEGAQLGAMGWTHSKKNRVIRQGDR